MWEYLAYLLIIPLTYFAGFISLVPLQLWAQWYMEDTYNQDTKFHISCVVLGILVMGFMFWLNAEGVLYRD